MEINSMYIFMWLIYVYIYLNLQYIYYLCLFVGRPLDPRVGRQQVHVTGDELAVVQEELFPQHLGHHVGQLLLGRHRNDGDCPLVDVLPQEVVPYVYVFCALDGGDVVDDLERCAVVFVYNAWSTYPNTHRPEQHVHPDELLDRQTQRHVFCLASPSRH